MGNVTITVQAAPFRWENIWVLPEDPRQRQQLTITTEGDLDSQFSQWLVRLELKCTWPNFDTFLIDYAAETLGVRLYLCRKVQQRLIEWEYLGDDYGLRCLRRFNASILSGAHRIRPNVKGRGTITPAHVEAYEILSVEVGLWRERIRSRVSRGHVTFEEALAIMDEKPDSPALPSLLHRSRTSLIDFYHSRKDEDDYVTNFINARAGMGAKDFVVEWMASNLKMKSGTFRNGLTKMRVK